MFKSDYFTILLDSMCSRPRIWAQYRYFSSWNRHWLLNSYTINHKIKDKKIDAKSKKHPIPYLMTNGRAQRSRLPSMSSPGMTSVAEPVGPGTFWSEPEPMQRSGSGSTLEKKDEIHNNILFVNSHIDKRLFKKQILIHKWKFSS